MELSMALAASLLPGSRLVHGSDAPLRGAAIDSRRLVPGELFVALRGARDGHDFASDARAAGAAGLLVERELALDLPQIVVPDTRAALAQLGAAWRARHELDVITVAGSNGKTTVTQMIASILARAWGGASGEEQWLATRGNLNNALGLPLMLLGLRPRHRAAVFELGMNHPGEMAPLSAWARPTVALVNNAQREHQEFLDSVLASARENGESIRALGAQGCAVFPADDPCAPVWRELAGTRRIVDFSLGGPALVRGRPEDGARASRLLVELPSGSFVTEIALAGEHNARNALAAAAAAFAAGVPPGAIDAGLRAFRAVPGRGTRRRGPMGAQILDETYNANPDSVRASIDTLAHEEGWRLLLLGDMAETGNDAIEVHREVGAFARERGIDAFLATGVLSRAAVEAFGTGARHFEDAPGLARAAREAIAARSGAATVLVKGSRSMRMERVVEALAEDARDGGPGPREEPAHA